MRSSFVKYFFLISVLLFFSFTALGISFLSAASNSVSEQRLQSLRSCADEVCRSSERFVQAGIISPDEDLRETLRTLSAVINAHVMVCDPSGKVLVCSDGAHTGARLADRLTAAALRGEGMLFDQIEGFASDAQTIALGLVQRGGITYGITVVNSSPEFERTLLAVFSRSYMFSAVIVLLVAVFSVYGTTRFMARPMRDMAVCAQSFAQGNFTVRVNRWTHRTDELGELACAFNAMADALAKQEELRRGFIANVSHELKTPMTIIAGYIGGLLDGTIPRERESETLALVRDEVLRLSRMVSSMTQISLLQSGQEDAVKFKSFDLCEMAMRVLLGMEGRINAKGLKVGLVLPEQQEAYVFSDPDGMTQVLTNLLDNAVKFSDEAGELTVSIVKRGGQYIVSVRNQGPTIPPGDIRYIFDRFHKADRSRSQDRSGLGLGLYLVKNILGAQKVDIFVTSENGETEFKFALPESREERSRSGSEKS